MPTAALPPSNLRPRQIPPLPYSSSASSLTIQTLAYLNAMKFN